LVLTHDVESEAGMKRVRSLAELEMRLGFRSAFGFVPEGSYEVPADLLEWLQRNGFEVMVHDLHHDGSLYRSRGGFNEKAKRINHYLKKWKAVGFRSGFMLRQLDWLHELEIEYDASTFDTDPFEPQPEGANTIFPFFVQPQKGSRGFIELPYTLVQDFNLFVVLQERDTGIWKQKLSWIRDRGGMALLDSHPDYMTPFAQSPLRGEYPIERYAEFLEWIRKNFDGEFWQPLPKEAAAHARKVFSACGSGTGHTLSYSKREEPVGYLATRLSTEVLHRNGARCRVLMLVENNFPQDTRVRNEAFLLQEAGYHVSVLCYRKSSQPSREIINGVDVYRMPRIELFQKIPRRGSGVAGRIFVRLKSFAGYLVEYTYFTGICFLGSCRVFLKSGFDVVHVHNPPDTLFLVGLPFKLVGKKFIFDHHDLCPELYQSRYGAQRGLYTTLLTLFEWCSLKLADVTIATNETYRQKQISRAGKQPERIFVVRNGPNLDRMRPRTPSPRLKALGKTILCYIGSLNPQDGVDYLLRSLSHLRHQFNRDDFHCVIMGSGDSLADLRALARSLKLDGAVELTGFVPDEEMMQNLASADICVDPDPSSPLNDVSTWIKIMEYMACSKPIVSFDLKETRYSAQNAALFVPPNDEIAFAKAIARLMDDPELRSRMGAFGRQRVERELQWSVTGRNLLAAYQFLFPESRANN
jgi:glycosyltransferase involved in cell wall biosynthesis